MKRSTNYSVVSRKDTERFTDRWQCRTEVTLALDKLKVDVTLRTGKLLDGTLGTMIIAESKDKHHSFLWLKEPCLRADLCAVRAAHNRTLLVRESIYETVIENFSEK